MKILVERLSQACASQGFDVVAPFNRRRWSSSHAALPDVGLHDALGVVIGNTRALWRHVRHACQVRQGDPVDRYTEEVLTRIVSDTCAAVRHEVVWAHDVAAAEGAPNDAPQPFPMQRLAAEMGLASMSPSGLAIHPVHGPWWALRAVVVIAVPGPSRSVPAPDICGPCHQPCVTPFERARGSNDWRLWLAARDACPVARAARYDDEQVAYHYRAAFGAWGES